MLRVVRLLQRPDVCKLLSPRRVDERLRGGPDAATCDRAALASSSVRPISTAAEAVAPTSGAVATTSGAVAPTSGATATPAKPASVSLQLPAMVRKQRQHLVHKVHILAVLCWM